MNSSLQITPFGELLYSGLASSFAGVALFNFEREFSAESNPVVSQAAKQSCEQQQRDVFESHRHRTFSLAFYMTGNEIEAEEILATTFIRAFQQNSSPMGSLWIRRWSMN